MSDNPRQPGHPSDMNSSRSSEGSNISSQHTTPVSPSYQQPPSSAPNHQSRNIILGAIATVVTSVLIYYLTVYMNRPRASEDDRLQMKEASIEAWKSYRAYENTYVDNLLSFEKTLKENANVNDYAAGLDAESKKFTKDLTDLTKTKHLDKDLIKAFNRRLENEKNASAKAAEYFANIQKIFISGSNPKKLKEDYVAEEIRWSIYSRGTFERTINDIQEIAKILTERYGQSFTMNDFQVVKLQPERQRINDSLINVLKNIEIDTNGNEVQKNFAYNLNKKDFEGNWNVEGDVVALKKDGSFSITQSDGIKGSGTWKIANDRLIVKGAMTETKQELNYSYRVSNLTASSFTISTTESPYLVFDATRITTN